MLGFFLLLTHYFFSQKHSDGTVVARHGDATDRDAHPGAWRRTTSRSAHSARYAGLLLAQALPFMLITFVLFPRVTGPLWGLPQDALRRPQRTLGAYGARFAGHDLILSGAIAFRVKFDGKPPDQSSALLARPRLQRLRRSELDFDPNRQSYQQSNAAQPSPARHRNRRHHLSAYEINARTAQSALAAAHLICRSRCPRTAYSRPTLEALNQRTGIAIAQRDCLHFGRRRGRFCRQPAGERRTMLKLAQTLRLPRALNPRTREILQPRVEGEVQVARTDLQRGVALFRPARRSVYTLQPPLLGRTGHRRLPLHHAQRILRALRFRLRLSHARCRHSRARRRRLPGRRDQSGRRLPHCAPVGRPCLGRNLDGIDRGLDSRGPDRRRCAFAHRTAALKPRCPPSDPLPALVRIDARLAARPARPLGSSQQRLEPVGARVQSATTTRGAHPAGAEGTRLAQHDGDAGDAVRNGAADTHPGDALPAQHARAAACASGRKTPPTWRAPKRLTASRRR